MGTNQVKVDKYALYNACLANHTSFGELSVALGMCRTYVSMRLSDAAKGGKGVFDKAMYEQMKGMLGVTDDSLIKAVPVERNGSNKSIYSPYVTTEVTQAFGLELSEENAGFISLVSKITSIPEGKLINNIIKEYIKSSEIGQMVERIKDATSAWAE